MSSYMPEMLQRNAMQDFQRYNGLNGAIGTVNDMRMNPQNYVMRHAMEQQFSNYDPVQQGYMHVREMLGLHPDMFDGMHPMMPDGAPSYRPIPNQSYAPADYMPDDGMRRYYP